MRKKKCLTFTNISVTAYVFHNSVKKKKEKNYKISIYKLFMKEIYRDIIRYITIKFERYTLNFVNY